MSERSKKIVFIIGFLAVTILIGYLFYYLFLRPSGQITPPTNNINGIVNGVGGLPIAGINGAPITYINVNGQLVPSTSINTAPPSEISNIARGGVTDVKALTDSSTLGATGSADGKGVVYYNKNDGKFYRINADGQAELMTDKVFHDVQGVYWAPSKDKAILEYPDGSNIVYNFTSNKQDTLPSYWQDFSFSPDSNQIVFKSQTVDPEDRWLSISKDDGSSSQKVERMGKYDKNVTVDWSPNKQVIATFTEGLDFDRQYLYFVGLNHERYNATIIEGRDYRSEWSPDGERLLYSVYSAKTDLNPMLWVVDAKGENIGSDRTPLSVNTWADKCTFEDNETLYCAVPKKLEKGSGLVPEYAASVPDDFYRINLTTGTRTLIATTENNYNAANLTVSEDGRYLYFTDKNDNKLYQLRLK